MQPNMSQGMNQVNVPPGYQSNQMQMGQQQMPMDPRNQTQLNAMQG